MTHVSQKHMIHSIPWDVLVILDACRYDYFKEEYSRFFGGTPLKVYSSGDGTIQWIKDTWTERYPGLVYFMANPTMGNGLSKRLEEWNPLDRFDEVIELWRTHWGETTVHPRSVVDEFIKRGQPTPAVLHFDQPHYPYLGKTKFEIPKELMERFKDNPEEYPIARNNWIKENNLTSTMRKAYRETLKIVLREVRRLAEASPGLRIVITSDHGEWLGEGGNFFHTDGDVNDPILRYVPWLEVQLKLQVVGRSPLQP